ncbi:hypothetical protein A3D84_00450 [Candidatus Woesebacteria bacterium RIFCSPHIGHO2_02_FULL_42_20]|uniref:Addiction module toxin, HicA family n=1 Tax=Candidatus Woesebacteria bacterium RIFCSPHIGHO2_12_FULL_41_24 TaxID=1802510 RepID=A0A1F8ATS4_9BACT|nr:MAG: hypothetical protein A2W15_01950 [Candidatus Woesebacteria bacterium RBG_16_41_13]OGM29720.1 MAG: hypothetical protein A2873_02370 [Candidatus Woesebacteria bacterium RIFCSPHIGHO2_01_FULL_42_80]OGM35248.1 MAG: hypothetical protein A3D84_00450 [Candidatus Woesebacteria bacterium RIFCSPHIGHO2_02_FULL_42_20]OGM55142.1 MAG: hypothetical protein A3E44_04455 [Candidatus Woesebacteria bacterium RIFCSPHIGHO2_12_FULL_41_24]OGM67714.1 MAG: hypothetical protein A2969_02160 [Candidatus Woesebacteri
MPQIKPRQIQKVLLKSGFVPRPGKGSHTVVPVHNRPVRIGTLYSILGQAGIKVGDFLKLLKK